MAPYIGYDSDTTFIPGTLNTSSSLTIQGGGITQTGGDVNLDSGTLFIDEDLNRVGIGVTTPGETLTVDSGTSVGQVIVSRFRGTASGTTGQVISILTSNLESGAELQAYSLSTTNNNGALLNLNDAIVLRSSSATSGGIAFTTANSTAPLIFATDSGERLRITPTGNVGIGITNPSTKLHVVGSTTLAGTGNRPVIIDSNVNIKMESGGWATQHGFLGSSDSNLGGFGAYGNNNSLTYYWIGQSYLSPSVVVGSSGNVGIGTNSPSSGLHLYGNGTLGYIVSQAAVANQWLTIGGNFADPVIGYPSTGSLRFGTTTDNVFGGFIEQMRITPAGNVGIGTTNPGYTLDVQGSQNVTAQISLWGRTIGQPQTLIEPGRIYATAAGLGPGNLLLQPTGGNIGIGTDSPSERFHIHAPGTDLAAIRLSGTATLQTPYRLMQGITGVSNAGFSIYDLTAASTRFAIDSAGNVGIGISNPSIKLDVNGSIRAYSTTVGAPPYIVLTYDVTPVNGAAHGRIAVSNSSQSPYSGKIHLQPQYYNGSAYDYLPNGLVVDATGSVGIGTGNPLSFSGQTHLSVNYSGDGTQVSGYNLLVNGTRYASFISYPGNSEALRITTHSNSLPMVFQTNDQTRMLITATGNVGIGTTNPSEKLHVAGKIKLFDGGYPYIDIGVTASNYFRLIHDNPNDRFYIGKNSNPTLVITGGNNVEPGTDATQNLGSPSFRWANIYSADLQLSNEGSPTGNDVDGTWGAYTIQEGEENLYLINRRSGKKFKFVLEEVK